MAKVHCEQLKRLENIQLVCAADISEERTELFKNKYGFERTTINYKEELNSDNIDIVLVATTWQPRFQIIKECLEAGKHVLAEKPLSLYLDEIDSLTETAKEFKVKLRIGYILRPSAVMNKIKELLDNGAIGKPHAFTLVHHQRGLKSDWLVMRNLLRGGVTPGIDCGIHVCDLLRWWFESEPESAYGVSAKLEADSEGDNFTHDVYTLKNGLKASIEECYSHNTSPYFRLAVYGNKGAIFSNFYSGKDENDSITIRNSTNDTEEIISVPSKGKATGKQMSDFLKEIDEDIDITSHLADVRKSTEMATGALISSKRSKIVKFPLTQNDIDEVKQYITR
jgi:myo-inositol 2-dehydrogenase/D-chiro-inositol 1-dehydrogenase